MGAGHGEELLHGHGRIGMAEGALAHAWVGLGARARGGDDAAESTQTNYG